MKITKGKNLISDSVKKDVAAKHKEVQSIVVHSIQQPKDITYKQGFVSIAGRGTRSAVTLQDSPPAPIYDNPYSDIVQDLTKPKPPKLAQYREEK